MSHEIDYKIHCDDMPAVEIELDLSAAIRAMLFMEDRKYESRGIGRLFGKMISGD